MSIARVVVTAALTASLVACASDEDGAGANGDSTKSTSTTGAETATEPTEEATYLEEGDLPDPLSLREVDGRTIRAEPFADFAVASGTGVWVSGVAPGAVRYDETSGDVTARTRIAGAVTQALEEAGGEVYVPTSGPNTLLRLDASTGAVRARVRLPGSPAAEGVVGADRTAVYVLVDPLEPTIAVVRGDEVTDTLAAPAAAAGVRAAFGALWVPTSLGTIERYDLGTGEWTTVTVGPRPRFLDVGFGAVWVMNQGDGSVSRVDGRTSEVETVPVTGEVIGGGDLTTGAGAVWLRTDTAVARIDPESRTVTHWIDLPPGSGSVAATDRALLITNHDHLAVHQVPLPLPG
ncbi:hypothetical protein [Nocardioides sp. Soil805]|uniref:hypothetical protein n=1 Tax=Nocardioides sp. Soil805 TaxID=1736416 RepID=UPI00070261C8|nr:hypothetical protein [Nocardioides sp. Soil805]KRF35059.1 hypothetical protein ASG94_13080 [Nocardioides sp. Soil805]